MIEISTEIEIEIEIEAPASEVWSSLVDFEKHPEWNPFITKISGPLKVGEKIKVSVQPSPGKGMTFHPKLLKCQENVELRWLGRFICSGIFDGEHYFQITPVGENLTRFKQGEKFSGLLVPLAKKELENGTKNGFNLMNQALKDRVEKR